MIRYTGEKQRTLAYLRDSVSCGKGYFRTKDIVEAIGLTAKQVGSRLPRPAEKSEDVEIEGWGCARSTAWHVTRS